MIKNRYGLRRETTAVRRRSRVLRLTSHRLTYPALVLIAMVCGGTTSWSPSAQAATSANEVQPQAQTGAVSAIQHIIWLWFENREASQITAATAPYFTSFAAANV